jgi:hypothetical protein
LITGARQVGKTTLARAAYPHLRYVNLDSVEDREVVRGVTTHAWVKQAGAALLDEAQKEPAIFDKIKFAFDSGHLSFSVLLGSAQILLMQRIRETLAGRVFLYELWPLTLAEIAAQGEVPLPALLTRLITDSRDSHQVLREEPEMLLGEEEARRITAAKHLAQWGGMPGLLPAATLWQKRHELRRQDAEALLERRGDRPAADRFLSRERWAKSDFKPLELFAESVGDRFRCGLVVTKGGRIEPTGRDGRFWAVPFHRLFS